MANLGNICRHTAQEILQILLQGIVYVECAVVQTADETRKLRPRSAENAELATVLFLRVPFMPIVFL